MENIYVKRPLYPLLSLLASTIIFIYGLIISKEIAIIYFLFALTIIYAVFGYIKVLLKVLPIFFIIGLVVGGAYVTSGNYLTGIQTMGRILLLAYSSIIMVALPPINLTRNLVQLKFPRIITLGMLVTIKFVPILLSEIKQIREAMKTRGVNVKWYNLSNLYRAFLIPFIMRIISMSDIMSVSLETRGFVLTDKSTTVYKKIEFTLRDGVFAFLITITLIGVSLWKK